ncbi:DNA replication and checkpoint protein-domain-containing protein [Zopfochytrium polystomum]|nr:DNA replication and checkpoint protein-domain-containing protein [Zopfochytrium polystomum]
MAMPAPTMATAVTTMTVLVDAVDREGGGAPVTPKASIATTTTTAIATTDAARKLKQRLKAWEAKFATKYGRPPTREDVKSYPDVQAKYIEYSRLKKTAVEGRPALSPYRGGASNRTGNGSRPANSRAQTPSKRVIAANSASGSAAGGVESPRKASYVKSPLASMFARGRTPISKLRALKRTAVAANPAGPTRTNTSIEDLLGKGLSGQSPSTEKIASSPFRQSPLHRHTANAPAADDDPIHQSPLKRFTPRSVQSLELRFDQSEKSPLTSRHAESSLEAQPLEHRKRNSEEDKAVDHIRRNRSSVKIESGADAVPLNEAGKPPLPTSGPFNANLNRSYAPSRSLTEAALEFDTELHDDRATNSSDLRRLIGGKYAFSDRLRDLQETDLEVPDSVEPDRFAALE